MIKLDIHIWARYCNIEKDFNFTTSSAGPSSKYMTENYAYVAPYTIELEETDKFSLRKGALLALESKRKLILAQNQTALDKVDADIAEFWQ